MRAWHRFIDALNWVGDRIDGFLDSPWHYVALWGALGLMWLAVWRRWL